MLWLRLIEEILGLDIVQSDFSLMHIGNNTSVEFLTKGKLRFTVEVVDDQVTLVFREYGTKPIDVVASGVRRSILVRGQERKIIDRIKKVLRKKKMLISFEEIENAELTANHERKVVFNQQ